MSLWLEEDKLGPFDWKEDKLGPFDWKEDK